MKQSILYGNGVNLLTKDMLSWDKLINSISKSKIINKVPNTLKYEAVLLEKFKSENWETNKNMPPESEDIKKGSKESESDLKKKLGEYMKTFGSNFAYGIISKMPFDHFMTTNYDKALFNEFEKGSYEPLDRSEKIYSIRRNYRINTSKESETKYWPIHGDCERPRSIMLGYDHYCGSIGKIGTFIKGGYPNENKKPMPSIEERLKEEEYTLNSWIDLFFISDIHIIGLGLDYDEIDLWWILNRRKRIMSDMPGKVNNKIYYYEIGKTKREKRALFKTFEVDFIRLKDRTLIKNEDYASQYYAQLEEMKTIMDKRKNV